MKQRVKVYHGIPITPVDVFTNLYMNEVGSIISPNNSTLYTANKITPRVPYITGYGITYNESNPEIKMPFDFSKYTESTLDFWYTPTLDITKDNVYLIRAYKEGETTFRSLRLNPSYELFISEYLDNVNKGSYGAIKLEKGKAYHIRWVNTPIKSLLYVNGKLEVEVSNAKVPLDVLNKIILYHATPNYSALGIVSDFNLSIIDRGDTFYTLPQDFLEGNAILKTPLLQQQIHGDPIYSQTTDITVPSFKLSNRNLFEVKDNTRVLISNPEVTCTGTSAWESGSTISIQGLSKEILTGVLDTDTTVVRILPSENGLPYNGNPITLRVEDTSKITVGDSFLLQIPGNAPITSSPCTVTSIDTEKSTITMDNPNGWNIERVTDHILVEVTSSTSSPIVQTTDGTVVQGTWSGLGTNKITFTFGENASIADKDLTISYCLNMPSGNSDYRDIPCDIICGYDSLGNKLAPTSTLKFVTDFKGKVSRSKVENANELFYTVASPTVELPSKITNETQVYNKIANLNDNSYTPLVCSTVGNIPQILLSFDLIRAVEDKLGCKISGDKVKWLRENVSLARMNIYLYATNAENNTIESYIFYQNKWNEKSVLSASNNFVLHPRANSIGQSKWILDDGTIKYLVCGKPTTDIVNSVLNIDYVELSLTMKTDLYTVLNNEEVQCNPILVQKETKTVKRLVPSNEPFSVEYYTHFVDSKAISITSLEVLAKEPTLHLTSQGTGKYPDVEDMYNGSIANVMIEGLGSHIYCNDPLEYLNLFGNNRPIMRKRILAQYLTNDERDIVFSDSDAIPTKYVSMKPFLAKDPASGEIKLNVSFRGVTGGKSTGHYERCFSIPNAPLIK